MPTKPGAVSTFQDALGMKYHPAVYRSLKNDMKELADTYFDYTLTPDKQSKESWESYIKEACRIYPYLSKEPRKQECLRQLRMFARRYVGLKVSLRRREKAKAAAARFVDGVKTRSQMQNVEQVRDDNVSVSSHAGASPFFFSRSPYSIFRQSPDEGEVLDDSVMSIRHSPLTDVELPFPFKVGPPRKRKRKPLPPSAPPAPNPELPESSNRISQPQEQPISSPSKSVPSIRSPAPPYQEHVEKADPIKDVKLFLKQCQPPMSDFLQSFLRLGFRDDEHLHGVLKWPQSDRFSMLRKWCIEGLLTQFQAEALRVGFSQFKISSV